MPATEIPCYCIHIFTMTAIGILPISCNHIPNLHCIIPGTRGKMFSVRRPHHSMDPARVPMTKQSLHCCQRVPYVHRLIITSRGDVWATGRPCQGTHGSSMTLVDAYSR